MPENTFVVGDVVQLKSGGPIMTVCNGSSVPGTPKNTEGIVYCAWFPHDKAEDPHYNRFETGMLRSVAPPPETPGVAEKSVERVFGGDHDPSFAAWLRISAEELKQGRLSEVDVAFVLTLAADEIERLRKRLEGTQLPPAQTPELEDPARQRALVLERQGRILVVEHKHFWTMAREILDYCREGRLHVLSSDDLRTSVIRFTTNVRADDPRYREWRMALSDVSRTANDRPSFVPGLSAIDAVWVSRHMSDVRGRIAVAKALSLSCVPMSSVPT